MYARASTDKQGETVDHQVSLLREVVRARRLGVVEYVYEEPGVSASKYSLSQRPEMARLMKDAESGKFQTVLFKGISRLARSVEDASEALDRLKTKGLRVISYEENYDSSTAETDFLYKFHALIAEYEAEKTAIRVRLGNKEKARSGNWTGMPPYGYAVENRRLIPHPVRAEVVKRIFNHYVKDGMGTFLIAEALNRDSIPTTNRKMWSRKLIADILRNQAYVGRVVYNKTRQKRVRDYTSGTGKKKWQRTMNPNEDWIVVDGAHEPLVSISTFERAQQILDAKAKHHEPPRARHPLTSILVCGKCGVPMVCQMRRYGSKEYRYYVCRTYHKFGRDLCVQGNVSAEVIESHVQDLVSRYARALLEDASRSLGHKVPNSEALQQDIKQIEAEIEKVNWQTSKLYLDRDELMTDEQFQHTMHELKRRSTNLMNRLHEKRETMEQSNEQQQMKTALFEKIDRALGIKQLSPVEFRNFVKLLVERIVVNDKDVYVEYKFTGSSVSQ